MDLERDAELDISRPEVRQAIAGCLPQTSCIASAMSCATKSRAREKQPGPPPLRSVDFPRGLPNLSDQNLLRVTQDNFSSDYAIAFCSIGDINMDWHAFARILSAAYTGKILMKCLFTRRVVGLTSTMMLACSWVHARRHSAFATTSLTSFHCQQCVAVISMIPTNGASQDLATPPSKRQNTPRPWSSP